MSMIHVKCGVWIVGTEKKNGWKSLSLLPIPISSEKAMCLSIDLKKNTFLSLLRDTQSKIRRFGCKMGAKLQNNLWIELKFIVHCSLHMYADELDPLQNKNTNIDDKFSQTWDQRPETWDDHKSRKEFHQFPNNPTAALNTNLFFFSNEL